jgi:hypothetical protein
MGFHGACRIPGDPAFLLSFRLSQAGAPDLARDDLCFSGYVHGAIRHEQREIRNVNVVILEQE